MLSIRNIRDLRIAYELIYYCIDGKKHPDKIADLKRKIRAYNKKKNNERREAKNKIERKITMTRFELNTLETLLRMFEQELEENGTNIEMFGSKLTEEQINLFVENTVNLKYLVMQIPK